MEKFIGDIKDCEHCRDEKFVVKVAFDSLDGQQLSTSSLWNLPCGYK